MSPYLLLVLFAITADTEAQWPNKRLKTDETCKTDLGNSGMCVNVKDCPAAIQLIEERGHPKLCRFDGLNPIVCCETPNVDNVITKLGEFESVAKQKCSEYVLQATITATTILPMHPGYTVGGVAAVPLEFPHMAILGYGTEGNIQWGCGGSLISEKFVLTAAHCIYLRKEKVAIVGLGIHRVRNVRLQIQKLGVKNTYLYPKYMAPQQYHDIALIELNGEAYIKARVKPACLETDKEIANHILSAAGWGALLPTGNINSVLQKVNLTSIPFDECSRSYQPSRRLRNGLIDDIHLCAGNRQARMDTCQGDSGGPLQFKIDGSRLYTIVGVTSIGFSCGILPSVYTRVSNYVSWIEGIVWPNDV